jgi:biopolymer transport protein ExbB/TolQ
MRKRRKRGRSRESATWPARWGSSTTTWRAVSPATLKATAPVGVALLASLLLQLIITFGVDPSSYVYRLFRPPGGSGMSLIPWLIVFLLFWTLVDLLLKFLDGRENERDLARGEIRRIPTLVADEPTPMLQRRILALDGADRPVARRLLWLLYYLERNADAQRTHELMRHQSDLDTDTAAAGYRTVKLFIWAMPILGFVGTVLGISLAVGGFSEFLTTNLDIDDVTQVTNELGNVASGLSFAFDTTLLGLLAGLIANVASSNVQKRDERFFTRLEELGLAIIANSRPPEEEPEPTIPDITDPAFQVAIRERIEEIDQLVGRTRYVMQELSAASARMNVDLNRAMESVRRTVDRLGTGVSGMAEALTAEAEAQTAVETAVGRLAASVSAFGQRVTEALAADAEAQTAVEVAVAQLATSIANFGEGLSEALAADAASQAAIEQAVERLAESVATFGEGVSEALAADTESQASVERAVERLTASIATFGDGIDRLQSEQEALVPVLSQLAGPLELRLVPGHGVVPVQLSSAATDLAESEDVSPPEEGASSDDALPVEEREASDTEDAAAAAAATSSDEASLAEEKTPKIDETPEVDEEPEEEPAEVPAEVPEELPEEEPAEVPEELPEEEPAEEPEELPEEEPAEEPEELPEEEPAEEPEELPEEEPAEEPEELPEEEPAEEETSSEEAAPEEPRPAAEGPSTASTAELEEALDMEEMETSMAEEILSEEVADDSDEVDWGDDEEAEDLKEDVEAGWADFPVDDEDAARSALDAEWADVEARWSDDDAEEEAEVLPSEEEGSVDEPTEDEEAKGAEEEPAEEDKPKPKKKRKKGSDDAPAEGEEAKGAEEEPAEEDEPKPKKKRKSRSRKKKS